MSLRAGRPGSWPRGAVLLIITGALAVISAFPAEKSIAAQGAAPRPDRKVAVDFVEADVNDVAKALSVQSGANVLLLPSCKGKVTVRLTNTTLEDALKQVASAVGSDVRKIDDTYVLGSTAELKVMVARRGVKETYTAKFTPATEIKELLQTTFPYLTVEAVGRINILVLAGSPEDVAAAQKLAQEADVAPPSPPKVEPVKPAILRETYVIKFARSTILIEALKQAIPELVITATDKTLVLQGLAEHQTAAAKLLAALDVADAPQRVVKAYSLKYHHPHQVANSLKAFFPDMVVQAGFEPYSPDPATFKPLSQDIERSFSQSGLAGSTTAAAAAAAPGAAAAMNSPGFRSRMVILAGKAEEVDQAIQIISEMDVAPQQVVIEARMVEVAPEKAKQLGFVYDWSSLSFAETDGNGGRDRKPAQFGPWVRAPFNWRVTLDALETARTARTLAKPNISVIDGEGASIFIGDILRFERLVSVTDAGQQIFSIETVPIGVALLCRPRIADGKIMLRVHPVVSTVTDFRGRNRDIPITASREAESVVLMQDGETIAIGGLLREEDIRILTKIPILGNIPFLGELFRHRSNNKRKSEVTIFITARVLKS